ncbi:hypothetical protein IMG5_161050 [Ichthyophthirius multifiliis]|uniref:Transmembrane protein n=1 Tax=Ichthyophthirius multifiliis TaxID=5932 RepID=G0R006_ICHMU|nr:hypothetical protein IMG5_161050 [Ichthyophthirius multifiliis]EGR29189.1 hypothetical protein IMG5_161050 [Ichthyophthirius multifiliis]|eukprot:XP_004030425.1 hypothetical protein IMG5_161050 [Ichthyophthirius multifiliis]
MINIPWFVRWGVDCALFFVPAYTFAQYPTTVFVFAAERRRKKEDQILMKSNQEINLRMKQIKFKF